MVINWAILQCTWFQLLRILVDLGFFFTPFFTVYKWKWTIYLCLSVITSQMIVGITDYHRPLLPYKFWKLIWWELLKNKLETQMQWQRQRHRQTHLKTLLSIIEIPKTQAFQVWCGLPPTGHHCHPSCPLTPWDPVWLILWLTNRILG